MELAGNSGSGSLAVVKALAMPTCNRVESAARSLRSYIENSQHFALECDYVVYDDSLSAAVRRDYRAMLKGLQNEFAVPIFYAGLEEKISFLKQVIGNLEIDPEIAKSALFDLDKHGGPTLGGNRNAVLLDNPGRAFVTVDDDTFCNMSRPPEATDEVGFVPGDIYSISEPCDFASFGCRDELLASLNFKETGFLKMHDCLLGRTLDQLGKNGAGSKAGMETGGGRILMTFNGLAGDCGWPPFASYLYFFVTGPSLSRLTSSTEVYQSALRSRQILRVSRQIFISPVAASPGAFFGVYNQEVLPPYMTLGGGNEDTFYWEMKHLCFPNDFFGYLPWALLHQPAGNREFRPVDIQRQRQGFDFYSAVIAFIRSLKLPKISSATVGERLAMVGKEFEALGRQSLLEFESTIRDLLKDYVKVVKECLKRKLEENTGACVFWREDLERFLRESWSSIDDPDFAVPLDFKFLGSREEALKLARTIIWKYGRLLQVWPDMVHNAAVLRSKGLRLAKPVA